MSVMDVFQPSELYATVEALPAASVHRVSRPSGSWAYRVVYVAAPLPSSTVVGCPSVSDRLTRRWPSSSTVVTAGKPTSGHGLHDGRRIP
jgi:hypothetical protein